MCSCSPMMAVLHKGSHLITALAAVNIGLGAAFNMDLIDRYLGGIAYQVDLVIGAAGVISLVMCAMCMAMGHDCKSCEKQ